MEAPTLGEIRAAAEGLREVVVRTPLVPLHSYDGKRDIWLKPEIHQAVTSFKIRGVFNAVSVLDAAARAAGLSTVSAGNTAQALAWTGRHFGVPARAIMPDSAPRTKIEAMRKYGGEPVLVPMAEVFRFLKEQVWEREPFAFIHPWTNRNVMIGHGTIGLEVIEDMPEVEAILVPVGGGGLIGGIASAVKALKPSVRVYGVEPKGCAALAESFRRGAPASVDCHTICDGVAVPYVTAEVFGVLNGLVDDVLVVSDEVVVRTVRRLGLGNRIIVEPSGALSVAAALEMPESKRGRCVCIVTGGSIDVHMLLGIFAEPGP